MENEFARRLKLLRIERNISQEELAVSIGASRSAVANWENGLRAPSLPVFRKLALYFNISTDYLSGKSEKRSNIVAFPSSKMDLSVLNSEGLDMLFEYYRFLSADSKYRL